jgi:hypothetical protein
MSPANPASKRFSKANDELNILSEIVVEVYELCRQIELGVSTRESLKKEMEGVIRNQSTGKPI